MNKNIDLTKILEGLEGIELYSPIFGECVLVNIKLESRFPITVNTVGHVKEVIGDDFTKEGLYTTEGHGECMLFPSKDQRDWSKFIRPIKEGTPMICSPTKDTWTLRFYAEYRYNNTFGKYEHLVYDYYKNKHHISYKMSYPYIIPFDKFNPNDIEGSLKYNIQNNGD